MNGILPENMPIPVANVNLNADLNGDGKIGLEEIGYILQKVAGLRPSGT